MAENINIKVLIDAAESAKTIQETKKALKDLRSAALQVEEGSQAFNDITTAAGQLQDRIGDLAATTKYLGDDLKNLKGFTSIAQGIAGGFAIAQGAAQLFGVENGKVEESIMKLQTAMSLLQGVQAVGEVLQKESAATLFLQNGLRRVAITLAGEQAVAVAAEAVATGTATLAQRALNAAMNANPILALVGLLAVAAGALFAFSKDTKEADKSVDSLNKSIESMNSNFELESRGFESAIEQLKQYTTGSKEREIAIKNINAEYGTSIQNLKDEKKFLEQVNLEVSRYSELAKARLMIKINESKAEDALTKAEAERTKLRQANKTVENLRKESAEMEQLYKKLNKMSAEQLSKQTFTTQSGLDMANALIDIKANIPIAIKQYENYADALLKINSSYVGKVDLSQKGLTDKSVDNEKDKNKKVIKEHKEFVADYKDLDNAIVENNNAIQQQIIEGWTNTYEKQSLELKASMESQKQTIIDEYNSALTDVDENFKSWAESNKINLVNLDTNQIKEQYDKFVATQVGLNQKLQILEAQKTARLDQINRTYLQDQEKLFREQSERIKEIILESTNIVLSTSEYGRYINYVEVRTKQLKANVLAANKETYDKIAKEYSRNFDNFEKYQELTKELAKSVGSEAYESEKGYYELRSQDLQKLTAEQTLLYDQNITDSKEFVQTLGLQNSQLQGIGSTLNDVTQSTNRILSIWTIRASRKDDMNQLTETFINQGREVTGADLTLLDYLGTLEKVGMITGKENQSILNFGKALDKVKDSVDVTNTAWGSSVKVTDQVSKNVGELIFQVLDLGRAINSGETGQNKFLSAIYLDKLNILKDAEKNISAEIITSNQKNLDQNQKFIDSQKSLITAYEETLKDKKLSPIDSEKYKVELEKAQEDLKKFEENQTKFIEKQKTQKSFAIKPTGPDQIGLEQLIKDYPELNDKIVKLLEERYKAMTKIENDFYEEQKYGLFMSLQKGNITQERYDKESETLEINHQENLLSIDVSYGKKGQDALAANEKKKGEIIKAEQEKVKASKEDFIQEMLNLEAQLSAGIMDLVNADYERRIDNLNSEYAIRIGAVAAEARAYELSLQDRTAAEIQVEQKKQAFKDEMDQLDIERQNKERQLRMEQFNKQKAVDIIQAGINGALAFTKALALTGPYALAIQGLVATQVAAQIGFIAAQQPAFAEGGLVTGPGGPKDDKISAKLSNGESVINAKSTKMYAPVLSAINQAGGGKAIPFAKGGLVTNTSTTMTIGEKAMVVDTSRLEQAINRLNERPVETYVKESRITAAQSQSQKEKKRTSF